MEVVDVVLGAMDGVDRGINVVPLVKGTPLTTRGGVALGVILMGVFE